MVHRL